MPNANLYAATLLSDHLQIFLGSMSYKLKTEVHTDGLFCVEKLMISFKWSTLISTILFIVFLLWCPLWSNFWCDSVARWESVPMNHWEEGKPKTTLIQLTWSMLWSEVCWNLKDGRTQYYHSSIWKPIRNAFMTLWRKYLDVFINKWSHGAFFFFTSEMLFLGLISSWLETNWRMLRNSLLT